MNRQWIMRPKLQAAVGFLGLFVVMVVGMVHVVRGSAADPPPSTAVPQRQAAVPAISFIDNPSATCYRPQAGTGACYIEWGYLNVTADSGSYIISMTVAIDNQVRAYHAGFFQTQMYIPAEMTAPGYRVTCGVPAPGSTTGLGNSYRYTIRALESSGLSAASYGTVACPADVAHIFVPLIQKP